MFPELLNREAFEELMLKINVNYSSTELENVFQACDENCTGLITMIFDETTQVDPEVEDSEWEKWSSIRNHLQNAAQVEEDTESPYLEEVQRLMAENEKLRNRIETAIPNLEKEKFELEMKLSHVERRGSMLEDDVLQLTSDVAMFNKLERRFRETKRSKEEMEGRLAKAEADVSRYRHMWEADRETMKTLREANFELINTVTGLNLSLDQKKTEIEQLQIQFDNMKTLKEQLEETFENNLDTQESHVHAREDEWIEREKALMAQINDLSKEVMDLKLRERKKVRQTKSMTPRRKKKRAVKRIPSFDLDYHTARRSEGETLGVQSGESGGEAIDELKAGDDTPRFFSLSQEMKFDKMDDEMVDDSSDTDAEFLCVTMSRSMSIASMFESEPQEGHNFGGAEFSEDVPTEQDHPWWMPQIFQASVADLQREMRQYR